LKKSFTFNTSNVIFYKISLMSWWIFCFIQSFQLEFLESQSMMTKLILLLLKPIQLKTSYNTQILSFFGDYNLKPSADKNFFPFYFSNKFSMYFLKGFWTLTEIPATVRNWSDFNNFIKVNWVPFFSSLSFLGEKRFFDFCLEWNRFSDYFRFPFHRWCDWTSDYYWVRLKGWRFFFIFLIKTFWIWDNW